jgi:hypothetical protein
MPVSAQGAEINTSMNKKLDKFTGLRPENYSGQQL